MKNIKKFWDNHPMLVCNLLALVLLFTIPWLSLAPFGIGLILNAKRKKRVQEEHKQKMISDANSFFKDVEKDKVIPTVESTLFLEKDEQAFLEESSKLLETRAVRHSTGSGMGFRVMKGVYVGGYSGKSESSKEWRVIDVGTLTLTSKRLVFRGNKENRSIPLEDILSLKTFTDSFEVAVDGKAKSNIFPVENTYIWCSIIQIIKSGNNPLNLKGVNLDLTFK